jgi:hypothetical protein
MLDMLLTILKIVAGLAVLGIISLVLLAVFSGLKASVRSLRHRGGTDDD